MSRATPRRGARTASDDSAGHPPLHAMAGDDGLAWIAEDGRAVADTALTGMLRPISTGNPRPMSPLAATASEVGRPQSGRSAGSRPHSRHDHASSRVSRASLVIEPPADTHAAAALSSVSASTSHRGSPSAAGQAFDHSTSSSASPAPPGADAGNGSAGVPQAKRAGRSVTAAGSGGAGVRRVVHRAMPIATVDLGAETYAPGTVPQSMVAHSAVAHDSNGAAAQAQHAAHHHHHRHHAGGKAASPAPASPSAAAPALTSHAAAAHPQGKLPAFTPLRPTVQRTVSVGSGTSHGGYDALPTSPLTSWAPPTSRDGGDGDGAHFAAHGHHHAGSPPGGGDRAAHRRGGRGAAGFAVGSAPTPLVDPLIGVASSPGAIGPDNSFHGAAGGLGGPSAMRRGVYDADESHFTGAISSASSSTSSFNLSPSPAAGVAVGYAPTMQMRYPPPQAHASSLAGITPPGGGLAVAPRQSSPVAFGFADAARIANQALAALSPASQGAATGKVGHADKTITALQREQQIRQSRPYRGRPRIAIPGAAGAGGDARHRSSASPARAHATTTGAPLSPAMPLSPGAGTGSHARPGLSILSAVEYAAAHPGRSVGGSITSRTVAGAGPRDAPAGIAAAPAPSSRASLPMPQLQLVLNPSAGIALQVTLPADGGAPPPRAAGHASKPHRAGDAHRPSSATSRTSASSVPTALQPWLSDASAEAAGVPLHEHRGEASYMQQLQMQRTKRVSATGSVDASGRRASVAGLAPEALAGLVLQGTNATGSGTPRATSASPAAAATAQQEGAPSNPTSSPERRVSGMGAKQASSGSLDATTTMQSTGGGWQGPGIAKRRSSVASMASMLSDGESTESRVDKDAAAPSFVVGGITATAAVLSVSPTGRMARLASRKSPTGRSSIPVGAFDAGAGDTSALISDKMSVSSAPDAAGIDSWKQAGTDALAVQRSTSGSPRRTSSTVDRARSPSPAHASRPSSRQAPGAGVVSEAAGSGSGRLHRTSSASSHGGRNSLLPATAARPASQRDARSPSPEHHATPRAAGPPVLVAIASDGGDGEADELSQLQEAAQEDVDVDGGGRVTRRSSMTTSILALAVPPAGRTLSHHGPISPSTRAAAADSSGGDVMQQQPDQPSGRRTASNRERRTDIRDAVNQSRAALVAASKAEKAALQEIAAAAAAERTARARRIKAARAAKMAGGGVDKLPLPVLRASVTGGISALADAASDLALLNGVVGTAAATTARQSLLPAPPAAALHSGPPVVPPVQLHRVQLDLQDDAIAEIMSQVSQQSSSMLPGSALGTPYATRRSRRHHGTPSGGRTASRMHLVGRSALKADVNTGRGAAAHHDELHEQATLATLDGSLSAYGSDAASSVAALGTQLAEAASFVSAHGLLSPREGGVAGVPGRAAFGDDAAAANATRFAGRTPRYAPADAAPQSARIPSGPAVGQNRSTDVHAPMSLVGPGGASGRKRRNDHLDHTGGTSVTKDSTLLRPERPQQYRMPADGRVLSVHGLMAFVGVPHPSLLRAATVTGKNLMHVDVAGFELANELRLLDVSDNMLGVGIILQLHSRQQARHDTANAPFATSRPTSPSAADGQQPGGFQHAAVLDGEVGGASDYSGGMHVNAGSAALDRLPLLGFEERPGAAVLALGLLPDLCSLQLQCNGISALPGVPESCCSPPDSYLPLLLRSAVAPFTAAADDFDDEARARMGGAGSARMPSSSFMELHSASTAGRLPSSLPCLFPSLTELDLSHNRLTQTAITTVVNMCGSTLQSLRLVGNGLRRLPLSVAKLLSLRDADLSRNKLGDGETLLVLSRLPRLQSLRLDHNRFECVPHQCVGPIAMYREQWLHAGVDGAAAAEPQLWLLAGDPWCVEDGFFSDALRIWDVHGRSAAGLDVSGSEIGHSASQLADPPASVMEAEAHAARQPGAGGLGSPSYSTLVGESELHERAREIPHEDGHRRMQAQIIAQLLREHGGDASLQAEAIEHVAALFQAVAEGSMPLSVLDAPQLTAIEREIGLHSRQGIAYADQARQQTVYPFHCPQLVAPLHVDRLLGSLPGYSKVKDQGYLPAEVLAAAAAQMYVSSARQRQGRADASSATDEQGARQHHPVAPHPDSVEALAAAMGQPLDSLLPNVGFPQLRALSLANNRLAPHVMDLSVFAAMPQLASVLLWGNPAAETAVKAARRARHNKPVADMLVAPDAAEAQHAFLAQPQDEEEHEESAEAAAADDDAGVHAMLDDESAAHQQQLLQALVGGVAAAKRGQAVQGPPLRKRNRVLSLVLEPPSHGLDHLLMRDATDTARAAALEEEADEAMSIVHAEESVGGSSMASSLPESTGQQQPASDVGQALEAFMATNAHIRRGSISSDDDDSGSSGSGSDGGPVAPGDNPAFFITAGGGAGGGAGDRAVGASVSRPASGGRPGSKRGNEGTISQRLAADVQAVMALAEMEKAMASRPGTGKSGSRPTTSGPASTRRDRPSTSGSVRASRPTSAWQMDATSPPGSAGGSPVEERTQSRKAQRLERRLEAAKKAFPLPPHMQANHQHGADDAGEHVGVAEAEEPRGRRLPQGTTTTSVAAWLFASTASGSSDQRNTLVDDDEEDGSVAESGARSTNVGAIAPDAVLPAHLHGGDTAAALAYARVIGAAMDHHATANVDGVHDGIAPGTSGATTARRDPLALSAALARTSRYSESEALARLTQLVGNEVTPEQWSESPDVSPTARRVRQALVASMATADHSGLPSTPFVTTRDPGAATALLTGMLEGTGTSRIPPRVLTPLAPDSGAVQPMETGKLLATVSALRHLTQTERTYGVQSARAVAEGPDGKPLPARGLLQRAWEETDLVRSVHQYRGHRTLEEYRAIKHKHDSLVASKRKTVASPGAVDGPSAPLVRAPLHQQVPLSVAAFQVRGDEGDTRQVTTAIHPQTIEAHAFGYRHSKLDRHAGAAPDVGVFKVDVDIPTSAAVVAAPLSTSPISPQHALEEGSVPSMFASSSMKSGVTGASKPPSAASTSATSPRQLIRSPVVIPNATAATQALLAAAARAEAVAATMIDVANRIDPLVAAPHALHPDKLVADTEELLEEVRDRIQQRAMEKPEKGAKKAGSSSGGGGSGGAGNDDDNDDADSDMSESERAKREATKHLRKFVRTPSAGGGSRPTSKGAAAVSSPRPDSTPRSAVALPDIYAAAGAGGGGPDAALPFTARGPMPVSNTYTVETAKAALDLSRRAAGAAPVAHGSVGLPLLSRSLDYTPVLGGRGRKSQQAKAMAASKPNPAVVSPAVRFTATATIPSGMPSGGFRRNVVTATIQTQTSLAVMERLLAEMEADDADLFHEYGLDVGGGMGGSISSQEMAALMGEAPAAGGGTGRGGEGAHTGHHSSGRGGGLLGSDEVDALLDQVRATVGHAVATNYTMR